MTLGVLGLVLGLIVTWAHDLEQRYQRVVPREHQESGLVDDFWHWLGSTNKRDWPDPNPRKRMEDAIRRETIRVVRG